METVVFTAEWQMKPDYTDMQKGIRHYHREILTISIHVPRTFLFFENSQQTHPSDVAVSLYCFGCENTYSSGTPLTILSYFPKSGSSSVFNKVFVNTGIRTSIVVFDCQRHILLYP